jgi:predicted nucleic acid-binding protein
VLIGAVRQELLSGIRERAHFERVRDHLRAFPDVNVTRDDYEQAASFFNVCRTKGIQGSNTDFLICAIAARIGSSIFTTDADFTHFARLLPITLHAAA